MTYIRKVHLCQPPHGDPGDIWRCDECQKVWRFSGFWTAWVSGPLLRWRYRDADNR